MKTKAYHRFVQRVEYYDADIELCDLLTRYFLNIPNSQSSVAQALGSTNNRHPNLQRRSNTKQSRVICGTHLKHTLYVAFIKDLFEDFSEFISETMTKAALKGIDPKRFVGEVKLDLHAAELLASGSWDSVVKQISDAIFRKLEHERNTKSLLKKAGERLGLKIDQGKFDKAMPYLDARHILIHRDGKADAQYRQDYPNVPMNGDKIAVDHQFITEARKSVLALALDIDQKIILSQLVRGQDMSGQR